jgi:cell division protein FtsQ
VGAAALAGVVVIWAAVRAVLLSSVLVVEAVAIEGTVRMPEGTVREVMSEVIGQPMFRVKLAEWRSKVRELSWVGDVSIRRVLPSTIVVSVTERRPLAIGRIGDSLTIIDHRGVIIDAYGPHYKDMDLPIVDGLAYADEREVSALEQSRAALAVRFFSDLQRTRDLAARVSQVDVSDADNAVVVMKGDPALLQLGDERFAERLQSYLDLADTLHDGAPEADRIDLRYGSRIFVTPVRASAASRRTGGGE